VKTSEAAKPLFRNPDPLQVGKHDAPSVADDDGVHRASAIDQDSDLAVDFSG
jgi:hypothetical protein